MSHPGPQEEKHRQWPGMGLSVVCGGTGGAQAEGHDVSSDALGVEVTLGSEPSAQWGRIELLVGSAGSRFTWHRVLPQPWGRKL